MTNQLYLGDCLEILDTFKENSVDTCITDPPYGLGFMGKEWDTFDKSQFGIAGNEGENDLKVKKNFKVLPRYNNGAGLYDFALQWATEVYRVLKPGGLLLAFGGTRTYHRLVCGIEDAGFEIRDTIAWVYGSGFPKSYNLGKGIDKFVKTGNASLNGTGDSSNGALGYTKLQYEQGYRPDDYSNRHQSTGEITTEEGMLWDGWGTALKPAMELIVVAMKPLDGTYVENALKWGVAGLWIDGGRVGTEEHIVHGKEAGKFQPNGGETIKDYHEVKGRFPANFIHDGSDEVLDLFPQTGKSGVAVRHNSGGNTFGGDNPKPPMEDMGYRDSGSAARFFYCAKASKSERNAGLEEIEPRLGGSLEGGNDKRNGKNKPQLSMRQNHHPTVKPIALMRYLARLTKTPTGGVVLDPFMGSGTTGCACALEGRDFIGIEKEPDYYEIAEKRIAYWSAQPKLL